MYILVARAGSELLRVRQLDDRGAPDGVDRLLSEAEFRAFAGEAERSMPRWVFPDTAALYPVLLAGGVRVRRAHDLRL